jgi:hypothetical protein
VTGLRGKRRSSGEKIRRDALAICRNPGVATTRASKRKAGRAGRGEAEGDAQHDTAAPRPRLRERRDPAARPLPLPATKRRDMMLKNVEAKTLSRLGAVASSPEVLDQLLLRRLAGKVRRCLALEGSRRSELSTQMEFPFTPSSRATVGRMNPPPKRGIMARCKLLFPGKRRECRVWT